MKNGMVALLTGITVAALFVGGCANNAALQKEAAIIAQQAAEKEAAKQAAAIEQAKQLEKAKKEEQERVAEQEKQIQQAKIAEQKKQEEAARVAEQARLAEQARIAEETAKAAAAEAAKIAAAAELKFETIYFDFDKSDLRQDARDVLSKNAETVLKAMAGAKIQIEGHCDERGSAEYNLALGEHRAKSAQKYMVTLGVKPEIVSTISYGKEKPAVQGNDETAWSKNRRAEFILVK